MGLDKVKNAGIGSRECGQRKIVLDHHIFDSYRGWVRRKSEPQPMLRVRINVNKQDYQTLDLPAPPETSVVVSGVADTGAMSCLWGVKHFYRAGFKKKDLIPVKQTLNAANRQPITILGAIVVRLSGLSQEGELLEAPVIAYVSPDTESLYVSRQAPVALRVISEEFPRLGALLRKIIKWLGSRLILLGWMNCLSVTRTLLAVIVLRETNHLRDQNDFHLLLLRRTSRRWKHG